MKERNYEDDLERYEQEFECNNCGNDLLGYSRTVANGAVWWCDKCKSEVLLSERPNEDDNCYLIPETPPKMSNKTVLQSIITTLTEKHQSIDTSTAINRRQKGAYVDAIMILNAHLPAEKQMIMDAHNEGYSQGFADGIIHDIPIADTKLNTADEYYTQTFKTK